MTAKEFFKEWCGGFDFDISQVEQLIEGFALMKCQELLEIVVEKALLKEVYVSPMNGVETVTLSYAFGGENTEYNVDEYSILNAVDLNEFIK